MPVSGSEPGPQAAVGVATGAGLADGAVPSHSMLGTPRAAPAFEPERKEIWYTDGLRGVFAGRVPNWAWPAN